VLRPAGPLDRRRAGPARPGRDDDRDDRHRDDAGHLHQAPRRQQGRLPRGHRPGHRDDVHGRFGLHPPGPGRLRRARSDDAGGVPRHRPGGLPRAGAHVDARRSRRVRPSPGGRGEPDPCPAGRGRPAQTAGRHQHRTSLTGRL
ncbi:MAG: Na(+) H(+) antiporter subunit G, partial [uncultured Thermomicrobiales bacterium]